MENGGSKPWQPIWIPIFIIAVIGVSIFVFTAPPEVQRGFLPGIEEIEEEEIPTTETWLLQSQTLSCTEVILQPDEVCQNFDIQIPYPVEKIFLKTGEGIFQEIDIERLKETLTTKIQVKKINSLYAFRVILPEETQIETVDFLLPDGKIAPVRIVQ